MTVISYTIKPEHLGLIGFLVPDEVSVLSPLKRPVDGALAEAKAELQAAGVTEENGVLNEQAAKTFSKLATATSSFAISFLGLPSPLEYVLYYPAGEKNPISVAVKKDSLVLDDPARPEEFSGFIKDCIGGSSLSLGSFEAQVNPGQALVLAALFDLHRRAEFEALGKEKSLPDPLYFSYDELHAALDSDPRPPWQWLRSHVRQLIDAVGQPGKEDTFKAIKELSEIGIVEFDNSDGNSAKHFRLNGNMAFAAENMGTFNGVFTASLHMEREEKVYTSSFTILQGGVYNLLYIEKSGSTVKLEAISPAKVIAACINMVNAATENTLKAEAESKPAKSAAQIPTPEPEKRTAPPVMKEHVAFSEPDSIDWFIGVSGENYGPYSWEQLQQFVLDGTINSGSLIWRKGMPDWVAASKVEGLL